MTKTMDWRDRLDAVLDDLDNSITKKVGVPDDITDRARLQKRLSSFLHACGRKSRSDEFDDAVRDGLAERHLYMFPPLDGRLPSDSWLKISRDPVPDPEYRFAREQDFQKFLEKCKDSFDILEDLSLVRAQYPLPDGTKIDLLYLDKKNNKYVAVELKHEEAGDGAGFQLLRYLNGLKEHCADREGRKVRGILIVGSVTQEQIDAFEILATEHDISMISYQLRITLKTLYPPDALVPTPSNATSPTAIGDSLG